MKHLRRLSIFVLSLIAVIVCALGLVACGDDKDPDTGNNGGNEPGGEQPGGNEGCTAHTYGEWQITLEATCTTDGTKKHVCTKCKHEETEKIDAIGHSWDEGTVTKAAPGGDSDRYDGARVEHGRSDESGYVLGKRRKNLYVHARRRAQEDGSDSDRPDGARVERGRSDEVGDVL